MPENTPPDAPAPPLAAAFTAAQTPGARVFLFLQGPHGPFFAQLAAMLRQAGARVLRVGFNRGDQLFWPDRASYHPFRAPPEAWPETCARLLDGEAITDLVLYGDTRALHAQAIALARARGLRVHVFEEGYLRPYWLTYERGGANGHSALMQISLDAMAKALAQSRIDPPEAPARWGDLRQHVFYGALYHLPILAFNRGYPHFRPHRSLNVAQEFRLYLRRLLRLPLQGLARALATARIRRGGFPYHLVLLQLAHDASFRDHGPFADQAEFIDTCLTAFAQGAPGHHHLVFKAHPLEDGRTPLAQLIGARARALGLGGRVHFVPGGKLAFLLGQARSAVTVNSTAGQQALWRGLPLKAFGRAVYSRDAFTANQPLAAFFQAPQRPDQRAYRLYRQFLLESSQVVGGYYSARGRRHALRHVTDMMLAQDDPYSALLAGRALARAPLAVVK